MKETKSYYELTNLMGLYANYYSMGLFDKVTRLFAKDAKVTFADSDELKGIDQIAAYFDQKKQLLEQGVKSLLFTFGQLTEIRKDENESRCLWMFLDLTTSNQKASHKIGRIDQLWVKEDGIFKIKEMTQFVRTSLMPLENVNLADAELYEPDFDTASSLASMENDEEVGEMLDILNLHSRYEQFLHCGNWDKVDYLVSEKDDSTWTVGHTRKKFLADNPDYSIEADGPAYSEEPPYWMGAKVGHESVIKDGFGGMTVPFSKENKGLYCCSDMLMPLITMNKEAGKAYTSVPSYGGFIMGPAMMPKAPYPVINSIGRWHLEWTKEQGEWKMHHFIWSTFYEYVLDKYDPETAGDWLSAKGDAHNWPENPEPYNE